ncbi:ligand-binding sensor domain-containing protein [Reichenbachiella ulvae]|uniref:histidine kinase n=1 Tax=Reichenbachiella ulvae TaxID=2980104 RepID=A0ABT3CWM7_9BACT|nr:sensor histidine kinase [Reichenbachiella ulvae]MCV9387628.1 ATP-binding protein [Reichenbachiella ulvae]
MGKSTIDTIQTGKLNSILFSFILSLLFAQNSWSQDRTFKLDYLGDDEGLSQNTINCIIQDKLGYIWFGTQDGLNRYNGYEFEIFRHDEADSSSISDNFVLGIDADARGNLWIATRGGGLNFFDIRTEKFSHYVHDPSNSNSISNNRLRTTLVDRKGNIWIGSRGGGLNRYNPTSKTFTRYRHSDDPNSLAGDEVYCLFEDQKGVIWIGTSQGLNRYQESNDNFITYLPGTYIRGIIEDHKKRLWIGSFGKGLILFNRESGQSSSYLHQPDNPKSLSSNQIMSLLEDDNHNLWVGTHGGHLNLFNPEQNSFQNLQVISPNVRTLYQDQSKTLWIGTRWGINKVNRQKQKFSHYRNSEVNPNLLTSNSIFTVLKDTDDRYWIGSFEKGLTLIDEKNRLNLKFTKSSGSGLQGDKMRSLFQDSQGNIWAGTRENGLYLYHEQTQKMIPYPIMGRQKISVNQIFEDSKNDLWFCTFNGLFHFDPDTKKFTHYEKEDDRSSLHSNATWSIREDQNGKYYIGLYAAGFDIFDPKSHTFTHFEKDVNDPSSLANDGVSEVFVDSKNRIWVAIYGGGLDYFDPETEKFTHYSRNEGLANTALYGILEDEKGHLWMSHNLGISVFDPETKKFTNYSKDDGLFGHEFNSSAYFKAHDNEMLFGGMEGLLMINPDKLESIEDLPRVMINQFSLYNKEVEPGKGGVLDSLIEFDHQITLDHNQNYLSFRFVALNYVNANNSRYQYKLIGFDKQWVEASNDRTAKYTNLPPGNYTFKVRSTLNGQFENYTTDQIRLTILTPWWKKEWFMGLCVLSIFGLLWSGYSYRTHAIKKKNIALENTIKERTKEIAEQKEMLASQNLELRQLNKEKNDLIGMVAHDLRTPLNNIKGLVSLIEISEDSLSEETEESIQLIHESTDRLRGMITKTLDVNAIEARTINLKKSYFEINELLKEVAYNFRPISQSKKIEILLEQSTNQYQVHLDKNYCIQIFENIISNAIKFSNSGTQIKITTHEISEKIQIHVTDQGPGISQSDMKKLFANYKPLSAKPTAGEESSGLGLYIVKKYVTAMNGKVWCESEVGKGSTFIVEFPLAD